jgi:hypothetical protein
VDGHHKNWVPRLGLAYSVSPKLTVRAGSGIFFARREMNQEVTQFGGNIPNTPSIVFPNVSASATINPPVTLSTPLVAQPTDATLSNFTPTSPLSVLVRTADFENNPNPFSVQWNFSVQYELIPNSVLEAAYSSLRGRRLVSRVNLNQISWDNAVAGKTRQTDRKFTNINNAVGLDSATGRSSYDSLLLRFEKRMSHGLNFLTNYT